MNTVINVSRNNTLENIKKDEKLSCISGKRTYRRTTSAKDLYVKSSTLMGSSCVYTRHKDIALQYSAAILGIINFHYDDIHARHNETLNSFFIGGAEYLKRNIPKINPSWCSEIKATNNVVVFNSGEYYKYTDKNGEMHIFSCRNNHLGQPYSDQISGRQNSNTYNIGRFWRMLSTNGTYLSMYYLHDEQRQYLNDAGINKGFFSVKMGSLRKEYFYSSGSSGVAISVQRYKDRYKMLTQSGCPFLKRTEPGTAISIGAKEYLVKLDHTLDIPYGEDIFDIELPKYTEKI